MRQIHRKVSVLVAPFLVTSAITGLLWAYAPYLYMKQQAPMAKSGAKIEESGTYLPIPDVIRSAKTVVPDGHISSISLKAQDSRLVYLVYVGSREDQKEVWVDAETGKAEKHKRTKAQEFHAWVMRIHRLEFFGTKKELVAIPGLGLLTLLTTGMFLWKRTPRR